jgi:hypothetical protein
MDTVHATSRTIHAMIKAYRSVKFQYLVFVFDDDTEELDGGRGSAAPEVHSSGSTIQSPSGLSVL